MQNINVAVNESKDFADVLLPTYGNQVDVYKSAVINKTKALRVITNNGST